MVSTAKRPASGEDVQHAVKRKREQGGKSTTFKSLPPELVLSVLQYLDGRSIVVLSSTCRYLKVTLEVMWATLFNGYIGVCPNLHAASWKEYLKRMFCAKERRCFVCLEKNSPSIRPWKFVNLCNDHRKHCTKSVLISKSYAKEQFSLNDVDMAPLQFIVRAFAFDPNQRWITEFCLSNDPTLTPAIAYSRYYIAKQRQDDIKQLCHNGSLNCPDKMLDVFQDIIDTFVEHGEVVLGFGKCINRPADVARILASCYVRLGEITSQMSPGSNPADDVQAMRAVLVISPYKTFVFDGVVTFLGATFVGAQKLVWHYIEAAKKCSTLEAKLLQKLKQSGSVRFPARGFLLDAVNSNKSCKSTLASLVQVVYQEWLRRDALVGACDNTDALDAPSYDQFVRDGYATLDGACYSSAKSLVHAVGMVKRQHACRRDALFAALKARGVLCHDVQMYHRCVFRWANEYVETGHIPFDYAIETTSTYLCNQDRVWKSMKYFGVARDQLRIRPESSSWSLLQEFIVSGSICLDGEYISSANGLVLYLLYVEKWPCHLYLDAILKHVIVSACTNYGIGNTVPRSAFDAMVEMRAELAVKMDAESFTNTMKIARRVVATYVSMCYQKFERSKRLHEALVSRKWPEISYANLELRHIYVKNGLPCFCGIEVSTLDQLADTLVKMHVSSIHRANALDTCLLDMGIPTWTPTLNRSMRLLSSQFVQYGVATVTKDFVLTSANCVGQNILSSPEYKRQMSLWRLAQQQQIDVVAALAEVGDFVNQVVLDWISRGVVHTSHKHGGTINSVDGILEFLVDHYRPKSPPFWGRIYLRHGVAPLQYFRDSYGGHISGDEWQFVTPLDTLGCSAFNASDRSLISNSSFVVLDRGVCSFEIKSRNVQAAGAAGLVIVSDTEEVVRPVAHVDKGEIDIPTVMVRKSGGDQIRVAVSRENVYGRLIPMTCPQSSVCGPHEPTHVQHLTSGVRGGLVHSTEKSDSDWEFLASTFGSPFLTQFLPLVEAVPSHACHTLDTAVVNQMVVIFTHDDRSCSFLTKVRANIPCCPMTLFHCFKVSNAQAAGAASVLLVHTGDGPLTRPFVADPWDAYNITIPSAMVSGKTARDLLRLRFPVTLKHDARVADAWERIASLKNLGRLTRGYAAPAAKAPAKAKDKKGGPKVVEEVVDVTKYAPVNILKDSTHPELKAREEYPEWLYTLLDPKPTLGELERKGYDNLESMTDKRRLIKLSYRKAIKEKNDSKSKK
ncbi:hypothetical protein DYB38_003094 [Aphanomyces astaci]|uniref:Large ribosomal subunit protein mL54 n=1 Tax=Aphanomyces astaci TaxID=112090 RepID=A0A397D162_APHAT|nr:hypothetical protein DYB38_003094 [Aphanomyces astaci]